MAQDDMYVVMYKILAYLYSCMKQGEKPVMSEWSASAMGINEPYWRDIVKELVRNGYLDGATVYQVAQSETIIAPDAKVTISGVEFLTENSRMTKARKFLQDIKASVPFI